MMGHAASKAQKELGQRVFFSGLQTFWTSRTQRTTQARNFGTGHFWSRAKAVPKQCPNQRQNKADRLMNNT